MSFLYLRSISVLAEISIFQFLCTLRNFIHLIFSLAKYTGNDSKQARQIPAFHMPVGFFKMYFMLGLFCLVFWLTELPIFLEMVFSNSQRLQRCLLGSGQRITTNSTDSGLSYCFNSIALSYPKPHLLGKSQKCCLL